MKELESPTSKFTNLVRKENLEVNVNQDIIFPFPRGFITDHLILRGDYSNLTICVYGQPVPLETIGFLKYYRNNIPLD